MKVPFSWLKQYVDIDITPEELEEKLFGCGLEVEEMIRLDAEISRVVFLIRIVSANDLSAYDVI